MWICVPLLQYGLKLELCQVFKELTVLHDLPREWGIACIVRILQEMELLMPVTSNIRVECRGIHIDAGI